MSYDAPVEPSKSKPSSKRVTLAQMYEVMLQLKFAMDGESVRVDSRFGQ